MRRMQNSKITRAVAPRVLGNRTTISQLFFWRGCFARALPLHPPWKRCHSRGAGGCRPEFDARAADKVRVARHNQRRAGIAKQTVRPIHSRRLQHPRSYTTAHHSNVVAMAVAMDPFEFLELERSATAEDIRKAYKDKCRIMHPDRNKSEFATEQFQKLSDAYNQALAALQEEAEAAPRLCRCGRAACELNTEYCAICVEERAPVAPRAPQSKQQQSARKLCLQSNVVRAEGVVRALKRKRGEIDRSLEHAEKRLKAAQALAAEG